MNRRSLTDRFFPIVTALLCTVWLLPSCGHQNARPTRPDYWPTAGWQTATPGSLGIDEAELAQMFSSITAGGYLVDGVVIIYDGYLVAEAYREPFGPDRLHIIHSCTKSILSACVGIAIDDGHISGTDALLEDLFPNVDTAGWDERKRSITLEDMLTMSTGMETRDSWRYEWERLTAMRRSEDWVEYGLSLPMASNPGEQFEYSNITSFLLSAAISEATGVNAEEFARERLFEPLGINEWRWPQSPDGITMGWGELRLLPTDLAKVGLLYLHGGRWDGVQIVPEHWVRDSWERRIDADGLTPGYGYQWWIPGAGAYALGYRGQYLIVNPDRNLVVVFVSTLRDLEFPIPERLYQEYILRALPAHAERRADLPLQGTLSPELAQAISTYSSPPSRQTDSIPAGPPPVNWSSLAGSYRLEENIFGLSGIDLEFAVDGTPTAVVERYPDHEEFYPFDTPPREFRISTFNDRDIAVRAGWNAVGGLEILYVSVGEAWWTRLSIRPTETGISIGARTVGGHNVTISGTRG